MKSRMAKDGVVIAEIKNSLGGFLNNFNQLMLEFI